MTRVTFHWLYIVFLGGTDNLPWIIQKATHGEPVNRKETFVAFLDNNDENQNNNVFIQVVEDVCEVRFSSSHRVSINVLPFCVNSRCQFVWIIQQLFLAHFPPHSEPDPLVPAPKTTFFQKQL